MTSESELYNIKHMFFYRWEKERAVKTITNTEQIVAVYQLYLPNSHGQRNYANNMVQRHRGTPGTGITEKAISGEQTSRPGIHLPKNPVWWNDSSPHLLNLADSDCPRYSKRLHVSHES